MFLHIALVSITKEVTLTQLAPVSAAIQKQISRDFGPMWNVEATVDAFDKLEDVPIGYWHVLLQDELPSGAAGLHKRDHNRQPFALVALTRRPMKWADASGRTLRRLHLMLRPLRIARCFRSPQGVMTSATE